MRFPIAIEPGTKKHAYGVTVPDLPGCFSAGDTLDEAIAGAREAILLHVEGLLDDGQPVPTPLAIDVHHAKRELKGRIWSFVNVDPTQTKIPPSD
jgi:predicted RNase H-like HicB family nuclease